MHRKKKVVLFLVILLLILLNTSLVFFYLKISAKEQVIVSSSTEYPEVVQVDMKAMDFQELSAYFKKIAKIKGAVYAFEILKRADLPSRVDTHLLAHTIGDLLFEQKGAQGIQYCTHDFRNACSHSIVIGLFLEEGESAIAKLAPLCEKAPGGKGAYGMCFHGLGHGVLALSDYDMHNAVKICDKLSKEKENKVEARECIGGTMMEMVSGIHDRETWKKQVVNYFTDDPLSPCDADFIPSYAKSICYTYLTPHFFIIAGGSLAAPTTETFQKAFPYCNLIPKDEKANRMACFGGFGKEFVVLAREKDVRNIAAMTETEIKKVYEWCRLSDVEDGVRYCLDQALNSLYWGGENNKIGALRFCNAALDIDSRRSCFNKLTGLISYYVDDKEYRKSYCEEIPEEQQSECKKRLL